MVLIIGSYSKNTDPGIHLYHWDTSEKRFNPAAIITGVENPSYLDTDDNQRLIYTITEKKEDAAAEFRIYKVKNERQKAALISCIPFQGAGSCSISSDSTRTHAFITNYADGTLTVIKLPYKNAPGAVVQHLKFSGSGPDRQRQDHPHLHATILSKDERHLYCTDLGSDRLYRFAYHPGAGFPLHKVKPAYLNLPPGSGPRHLALSRDGKWLYLVTELSGEIFVFDAHHFYKGWQQKISLLQEGYTGKVEAADIQIHPTRGYLYASNRGDANEIIVFSTHLKGGRLEFLQRISAAGLSPRSLLICKDQELLLVANEQSDNVSIFKLRSDGTLEFSKEYIQIPCPTCLRIITDKTPSDSTFHS